MTEQIYVHYGHKNFDNDLFKPIKNISNFSKPKGGLWASRIDAKYGWREWCNDEEFRKNDEENAFRFTLSDYAKILYIDSEDKLLNLPIQKNCIIKSWKCLDFEELLKNYYDAIEVDISKCWALYNELYGWDCDSILIMNPDIIREIKTVG